MGKDKDVSVFIKYGNVLYSFFPALYVYSRLKAFEKNAKIKLMEKIAILQYFDIIIHVLST